MKSVVLETQEGPVEVSFPDTMSEADIAEALQNIDIEELLSEEAPKEDTNAQVDLRKRLSEDEGRKNKVYKDTKGINTVGVGFNMEDSTARTAWKSKQIAEDFDEVLTGSAELSDESIDKLLDIGITTAREDASKYVSNFKDLSSQQQSALTNMAFQMGRTTLNKFKGTKKLIEAGKFDEASNEMLNSDWARKDSPARAKRVSKQFSLDTTR